MSPSVDRASAADLMQFATGDGAATGHIGAVLMLDAASGFSVEQARRVLGERICSVPRLRQRGDGYFIRALRRGLARRRLTIPFQEHDLASELQDGPGTRIRA